MVEYRWSNDIDDIEEKVNFFPMDYVASHVASGRKKILNFCTTGGKQKATSLRYDNNIDKNNERWMILKIYIV